jgi:hypothetical protein
MQPFTLRWLIPFTLVVLLLAGCGDTADDSADTTLAPATTTAATTTITMPSTTTVAPLPELAEENYEEVDASDVLLVEALVDAYNTGDGTAFTEAMGAADEVLYYDYFGEGGYEIQVDPETQAQSIEEWDHPLGFQWELRRCEPSEDLPDATQCAMYRYDPIADTEKHQFPVDAVLSVTTEGGSVQDVWIKYMEWNWNTLTWEFSQWVRIFHPDDWEVLFDTEPASSKFHYWDLHHSVASAAVLSERVSAWESMTVLSQNEEFYDWVAEREPEALEVMWPAGRGRDVNIFTEDTASLWTRLVDEYTG